MKRLPVYLIVGSFFISSSCTDPRGQTKTESVEQSQQEKDRPAEIVGKDGAPMDLVPAGSFIMGSPEGVGRDDEHPEHEVWLDVFYIDRYEVTVDRFEKCVQAGKCNKEHYQTNEDHETCNYGEPSRHNHPMNCLDWFGLQEYCTWAGKRLPTEAEWGKAARGVDGRTYPWGEEKTTCDHAVIYLVEKEFCDEPDNVPYTQPVGAKPKGVGPYGTHNLAGNVSEWCGDWYDEAYYSTSPKKNPVNNIDVEKKKVIRGGCGSDDPRATRTALRSKGYPTFQDGIMGGRCIAK